MEKPCCKDSKLGGVGAWACTVYRIDGIRIASWHAKSYVFAWRGKSFKLEVEDQSKLKIIAFTSYKYEQ